MNEPAVTVEDEKDVWGDYADWPIHGTQNVDLFLRGDRATPPRPGTLGGMTGGAADTLPLHAAPTPARPRCMNTPTGSQANRRVFLSRPLTKDVRLSGTATADLAASLGRRRSRTSASIIADYGVRASTSRRRLRGADVAQRRGPRTHAPRTCWGDDRQQRARRARPARPAPLGDAVHDAAARDRQRLLHGGHQADADRHAVARHARHPRLVEP